jgi:hypothetical protein
MVIFQTQNTGCGWGRRGVRYGVEVGVGVTVWPIGTKAVIGTVTTLAAGAPVAGTTPPTAESLVSEPLTGVVGVTTASGATPSPPVTDTA